METWLKKGAMKRELDELESEYTVAPDDAERNNLVTKKMKKEETSPTT
jgi:hypothetical protein